MPDGHGDPQGLEELNKGAGPVSEGLQLRVRVPHVGDAVQPLVEEEHCNQLHGPGIHVQLQIT